MIIMNYGPNDVISENVIGYITKQDGDGITVYEVMEMTIKHPEAPDLTVIQKFEVRKRGNIKSGSVMYDPLQTFNSAQNVMSALADNYGRWREIDKHNLLVQFQCCSY
jgi:hypothetical protein